MSQPDLVRRDAAASSLDDPAAAICEQLTRAGSIPLDIAIASLTPFERQLLRMVRLGPCPRPTPEAGHGSPRLWVCGTDHRVALRLGATAPAAEQVLLTIALSDQECVDARQLKLTIDHEIDLYHRQEVVPTLEAHGHTLSATLLELRRTLPRLAPFIGFIGDQIYCAEGRWGDNLTTRDDTKNKLVRLVGTPWRQWSPADQQFVFALVVLMESGGPYRLEGMNWFQLDPLSLQQYLGSKLRELDGVTLGGDAALCGPGMLAVAARLRALEERAQADFRLYRVINGTTLNKQLKCLPRTKAEPGSLPTRLATCLENRFGIAQAGFRHWRPFLQTLALRAHAEGAVQDAIVPFVWSGLLATQSDFFMSRGPRALWVPENYRSVRKTDFYCVVASRPGYDPDEYGLRRYSTGEIRWNQSLRMQFNGWKFWYGNLDASERAPNQYFFVPPKMPDVAACEDAVHKGHHENGVVQSIRSPGGLQLWQETTQSWRDFDGAMDTRAARSSARPEYTQEDLVQTIWHQVWLQTVLQELARCEAKFGSRATIDGFDRSYHQQKEPIPGWIKEAWHPSQSVIREVAS